MIQQLIKLLRPQQWIKNGFVFLPMFFGGMVGSSWCWRQAIIMFFSFSFAASAVYCFNDAIDVESDRQHPQKRFRPIASGAISIPAAYSISIICVIASILLCFHTSTPELPTLVGIICLYLGLNVGYCLKLKQIGIVDVMIVSFGFVLRLAVGGIACNIILSPWIISLTFMLALFLAFAKRRDDVSLVNDGKNIMRKSIANYSLEFLNQTLGVIAAVTIVSYMMYTVSPDVTHRIGSEYVYITSFYVIAGILRYLQLSIVIKKTWSPTKILLHDRFIQIMIILWILTFLVLLYV